VASHDECRAAIAKLATRLSGPGDRRAEGLDRMVSAELSDLGVTFRGHLHDGVLDDITTDDGPPAQIRLVMSSDDLVKLAGGELSLGSAWLAGRVKVQASLPDLLRLRTMI
jgi:putative sterol carrier protein